MIGLFFQPLPHASQCPRKCAYALCMTRLDLDDRSASKSLLGPPSLTPKLSLTCRNAGQRDRFAAFKDFNDYWISDQVRSLLTDLIASKAAQEAVTAMRITQSNRCGISWVAGRWIVPSTLRRHWLER